MARLQPIEEVISRRPFLAKRRICFSDCETSGQIYPPRYLDPIAINALEEFLAPIIGYFGKTNEAFNGLAFPAKALNMDVHSNVEPGDVIDIEVFTTHIGTSTFEVTVSGMDNRCVPYLDSLPIFDCSITSICIDSQTFKAQKLPSKLVEALESHMHQFQTVTS